jgi:hypothetical protein
VTTIAPNNDRLRELEDDTRRAWNAYSDRLRELSGEEYELAEHDSWATLQGELRRVERRRQTLNVTST